MQPTIHDLEPQQVFHYFYEINQIPRGSGNEQAISDYLVSFAKERGLSVIQDESLNVLIRKPASLGYEKSDGLILQGHMDMVCVKQSDSQHDFLKDPIPMVIEGDYLKTNGTTLGADNGIAVAMCLAILDSTEIAHPALEVLITTDEEVGMTGALKFDASQLTGRYFINLDSEEEGEITVGCAGGLRAKIQVPYQKTEVDTTDYLLKQIAVFDLKGGHSGVEIDTNRANSNQLAGRLLNALDQSIDMYLVDINGGEKDNVIAAHTEMSLLIPTKEEAKFDDILNQISQAISREYQISDPQIKITSQSLDVESTVTAIDSIAFERLGFLMMSLPGGVQTMSAELPGMVESSLNFGVLTMDEDHVVLTFSIRSNLQSRKEQLTSILEVFASATQSGFVKTADYPAWEMKTGGNLLNLAIAKYEEKSGKKPIVKAIHAGLESGIFLKTMPELEAISIGPDMWDVHSPKEHLSIASTERTWHYLLAIMAAFDQ